MAEDNTEIIPFYSQGYVDQLPSVGYGKKLFQEIDKAQHEEEISPQLAEAMRKTLAAKESTENGSLEGLAIKGGIKYAVSQFEGMLENAGKAMEKRGEGNRGEIMTEWLRWVNQ